METIVDSSILVAFFNEKDPSHDRAVKAMLAATRPLVIHEYIFLETVTVLMLRADKQVADAFILHVLTNADIRMLHGTEPVFLLAIKNFMDGKTKQLSFVDSALLALSTQYKVLTFDDALARAIKKRAEN